MTAVFDLVIFDCDGVLVDSERVANEVFARALREVCGIEFTLEQMFDNFVGRSKAQCLARIEALLGRPPPDELERRYREDIDAALAATVEPVPGIERVLRELSLPSCVASSGSHEKMRLTLGKCGLYDHFAGKIFSTSEVARGKPHPDIYLHAAEVMGGFAPSRCLVIEDSPTGVTGAVAAGMTVFGYAELMPRSKLERAGAHRIFDDMNDLTTLIASHSPAERPKERLTRQ